jgi:DNA-binding beta-propeller fold protein YncE
MKVKLDSPHGVAGYPCGLIISDTQNHRIRKTSASYAVTTIGGGTEADYVDGLWSHSRFHEPMGIKCVGDLVILADSSNHRIRATDLKLKYTDTIAGSDNPGHQNGEWKSARFNTPTDVAWHESIIYVADAGNSCIRAIDTKEEKVRDFAGQCGKVGGFRDGPSTGDEATSALFNDPTGITVDAAGRVYVADTGNHRIRMIADGQVTTVAGDGTAGYINSGDENALGRLNAPMGVEITDDDILLIADTGNNMIRAHYCGKLRHIAGRESPGHVDAEVDSAQLDAPTAIALSDLDGFYVADSGNHVIRFISTKKISPLQGSDGRITLLKDAGASSMPDGGPDA